MVKLKCSLLLAVLTGFLIYGKTYAQTIQIQGEQTGILEADTVLVAGEVFIPENGVLTFLPGTRVIATGFYGFRVAGSISAMGTAEYPILFSVSDTAGFYDPENGRGGWDGFNFLNTSPGSDSSLFSNCIFEFGKAYGDSIEKMGGVFNIREFDRIRISDCGFNNNRAYYWGGAIFAESGNILIRNCSFNGNFCGTPGPPYGYGGAVCIRYSTVDLLDCRFTDNSSTGIGGAVSFEYSDVLLQSGIFTDNYSGLGGALGYLRSTPVRPVTGNLFTGNSSLFFGGAISCNRANPVFINNTIAGNSSVSYGGGVYCNDSAVPVLINTMICDNYAPSGEQVYIWDVYSAPEFYYCNVEGGPAAFGGTGGTGFNSPYLNNLDTVPGFSGIEPHPYSLADDSPCINAGNPDTTGLILPDADLAGNPRLTGNRIDIGAYESLSGVTGIKGPESVFSFECYPNPFHEELRFNFPGNINRHISIRITDITGKEILFVRDINADSYIWNRGSKDESRIVPGIYIVNVNMGSQNSVARVICTK
ncbi:MAG: choice-of-anchor Q domain-containing protein [Lentimicrobium sp.]